MNQTPNRPSPDPYGGWPIRLIVREPVRPRTPRAHSRVRNRALRFEAYRAGRGAWPAYAAVVQVASHGEDLAWAATLWRASREELFAFGGALHCGRIVEVCRAVSLRRKTRDLVFVVRWHPLHPPKDEEEIRARFWSAIGRLVSEEYAAAGEVPAHST